MFRISDVSMEGDSYHVIPTETEDTSFDFNPSDFYTFLKIDTSSVGDVAALNMMDNAKLLETKTSYQNEFSVNGEINFEKSHFSISGGLGGSIIVGIKIEYDVLLFGPSYFKFSTQITSSLDLSVSATAKTEGNQNRDIFNESIGITIPIPNIPIASVTGEIVIEGELEGGLVLSGQISRVETFSYSTKDDKGMRHEVSGQPTWSLDCKGEVTIRIGPQFSVNIGKVGLLKPCFCGVELFYGAEIHAKAERPVLQGESAHLCTLCAKGEVYLVIRVTARLEINLGALKFQVRPAVSSKTDLMPELNFYVSLLNPKESMFHGERHWGKGECPNRGYRVQFDIKNESKFVPTTILITDVDSGMTLTAVENGETKYLPNGKYIADMIIDGKNQQHKFIVYDMSGEISFTFHRWSGFDDIKGGPISPGGEKLPEPTIDAERTMNEYLSWCAAHPNLMITFDEWTSGWQLVGGPFAIGGWRYSYPEIV